MYSYNNHDNSTTDHNTVDILLKIQSQSYKNPIRFSVEQTILMTSLVYQLSEIL